MNRYDIGKQVSAFLKLHQALMDSVDAALPLDMIAKAGDLQDECWRRLRDALANYYEGQP